MAEKEIKTLCECEYSRIAIYTHNGLPIEFPKVKEIELHGKILTFTICKDEEEFDGSFHDIAGCAWKNICKADPKDCPE